MVLVGFSTEKWIDLFVKKCEDCQEEDHCLLMEDGDYIYCEKHERMVKLMRKWQVLFMFLLALLIWFIV